MYATKEDVLKKIFQIKWLGQSVTRVRLAKLLEMTPAGIAYLIQDLTEQGYLICADKKSAIQLTEKGQAKAADILWKYGLWKDFLIRKTGATWSTAIGEAEKLEHETSAELASRLEQHLDYPSYCPLGVPIKKELLLKGRPLITLSLMKKKQNGNVRFIAEKNDLVNYLELNSLKPHKPIEMIGSIGFGGPYLIANENREIVLSEKAMSLVYVELTS